MRYISAKEYSDKKGLSLGYVYELMRDQKIPWVNQNKVVKRIPWDDEKQESCQAELVAQ
jgi:hypothetical protein